MRESLRQAALKDLWTEDKTEDETEAQALPRALTNIQKRDGRIVQFDKVKITNAIYKAQLAVGQDNINRAKALTDEVLQYLKKETLGAIPTVEGIQDIVERVLIEAGHAKVAKAYILYRDKRTRIRDAKAELMDIVADILVETSRENASGSGLRSQGSKHKNLSLQNRKRPFGGQSFERCQGTGEKRIGADGNPR